MRRKATLRHECAAFIITLGMIGSLSGCSYDSPQNSARQPGLTVQSSSGKPAEQIPEGAIPIYQVDGIPYVTVNDLCRTLRLRMKWDGDKGTVQLGDSDPVFVLQTGSTKALKAGIMMNLPQSPILSNSAVHLPVCSLGSLFQDEVKFEVSDKTVQFHAMAEPNQGTGIHFADDPQDPARTETDGDAKLGKVPSASGAFRPKGLRRQANMNELIQKAQRYLGVGYEYGAAPFPESGLFDSSSFTQYVYQRHGIHLERTSRQQSEQGTTVSPEQLRKGDLLFFRTPNRYRSAQAAHVGIYIGDNKMIHAAPEPGQGVQIARMDTPEWKSRFIKARRVVGPS